MLTRPARVEPRILPVARCIARTDCRSTPSLGRLSNAGLATPLPLESSLGPPSCRTTLLRTAPAGPRPGAPTAGRPQDHRPRRPAPRGNAHGHLRAQRTQDARRTRPGHRSERDLGRVDLPCALQCGTAGARYGSRARRTLHLAPVRPAAGLRRHNPHAHSPVAADTDGASPGPEDALRA